MTDVYDVSIKVISQKGHCAYDHKVGDEWIINDGKTPGGICLSAFASLMPNIRVLRFGGTFPWSTDPDTTQAACTDADNPVVFELRRLRK